jgi:hypothetical protein
MFRRSRCRVHANTGEPKRQPDAATRQANVFRSGNFKARITAPMTGSHRCGATAFERKKIIMLSGLLAMPE